MGGLNVGAVAVVVDGTCSVVLVPSEGTSACSEIGRRLAGLWVERGGMGECDLEFAPDCVCFSRSSVARSRASRASSSWL